MKTNVIFFGRYKNGYNFHSVKAYDSFALALVCAKRDYYNYLGKGHKIFSVYVGKSLYKITSL